MQWHCLPVSLYYWKEPPLHWGVPEGRLGSLAAQCSCPLLCWPGVLPFPHSFKNAFQSAALFKALAATGLLSGTCWVGGMKENLLCSFFISRCPIATLNPCFHNTVNLQLGLLLEDFVRLGSGNVVTSNQTEEREGVHNKCIRFSCPGYNVSVSECQKVSSMLSRTLCKMPKMVWLRYL